MPSAPSDLPVSFPRYVTTTRRIALTIEKRVAITGEEPSVELLPSQLAFRSLILSRRSILSEISAVRSVLRAIREGMQIEELQEFPWLWDPALHSLEAAITGVESSVTTIKACAAPDARALYERCGGEAQGSIFQEFLRDITGQPSQEIRVRNRRTDVLGWRQFMTLELALGDIDPHESVSNFINGQPSWDGMLRIFASVMFHTGIRPVEVWTCMLFVPDPDISFTYEMRTVARYNPAVAISKGWMRSVISVARKLDKTPGTAAPELIARSNIPAVFMVSAAKQTNANVGAASPIRLLILEGASDRDLSILAEASRLRGAKVDPARMDSARSGMGRALKRISKVHLESEDFNLYSFRHAFVTRARETYPPHEAAAITGHTSPKTMRGYGRPHARRKGSGSTGWMAKPDPVQAEKIAQLWSGYNPGQPDATPDIDR